jgi:hypothetical protein
MNDYSLAAESRRWWWLPATAGAVGTAAVTAIMVVPTTGATTPDEPPPPAVGGAGAAGQGTVVDRPCYLARPDWNTDRGWEHPVCTTVVRGPADTSLRGHGRPAPDHLP